jgi:hypothetical protein
MLLTIDTTSESHNESSASGGKGPVALKREDGLESGSSHYIDWMEDPVHEVELAKLLAFDTIIVKTLNSDYRILLLDPDTGRALLAGGLLNEATEGTVFGSSLGESVLRLGWLEVGLRFEAWANDRYIRSSPVQSLSVVHQSPNLTSDVSQ